MSKSEYEASPKLCLRCKCSIPYVKRANKYCGHSCAATITNTQRCAGTTCLNCGTELRGRRRKKYCSTICSNAHHRDQRIKAWLEGSADFSRASGQLSATIRGYLLEKHEACTSCGWCEPHPISGKPPLQVDHIDGDFANCRPENLRVLCPNCHALTLTFGARNKGKGRTIRGARRIGT